MKKVLLISLLVSFTAIAAAQNVTVYHDGNAIADNDTVEISTNATTALYYPSFYNNTDNSMEAVIIFELTNNSNIFAMSVCTGELCNNGGTSAPFTINSQEMYTDAHAEFYIPDNSEPAIFKMKVKKAPSGTTYSTTYLKVSKESVEIEEVAGRTTFKAFPNPATGSTNICYSLNSDKGTLVLYNLMGAAVREIPLTTQQGVVQLSLDGLPSGVYMYGIRNGQNMENMKKIVVK